MSGALPAVHDSGEGPAVLFLHSFPLDASQWDHQVAALSGRHRCLRPDHWGCASSPPPPDDGGSLDAFANTLLTQLSDLGIDAFDVVGASLGGYVAFALLRAAPARVRSLVLANTRATADREAARADRLALADRLLQTGSVEELVENNVERLLGPLARKETHVADPVRGRIRRWTPAGAAAALRAMAQRPDSSGVLRSAGLPTVVIAGSHDGVIPEADVQSMATAASAEIVTMDCGHLSNLEQPHVFTEHVRRFLAARGTVAV
ncbi:MAG: alpha/beta hydrolase [Candidatus Dormibacteraeota bacterium]|nr:alpha/beta hydrolase [Candidatus Dormibacteraeota bacterium]